MQKDQIAYNLGGDGVFKGMPKQRAEGARNPVNPG
jgi:hypothetical protein